MANLQMTIKEKNIAWNDLCTIMCSCGEYTVAYYCNDSQCPHNKSDPLYCSQCAINCLKHEHIKPPMMIDRIAELTSKWSALKEDSCKTTQDASDRYGCLETLIKYFEEKMRGKPEVKFLSADMAELLHTHQEVINNFAATEL